MSTIHTSRGNISIDELTERSRFLTAVDEGLVDSEAGRVHAHADVVAAMKKRFVLPDDSEARR